MAQIQISDSIFWDTEKAANRQSSAAQQWLDETRRQNADKVFRDAYGRIYKWIYETGSVRLTIEHKYVFPNSANWTLDKIEITVTQK